MNDLTDFDIAKIVCAVVDLRSLGSYPSGPRMKALAILDEFHLTEAAARLVIKQKRRKKKFDGSARRQIGNF